MSFSNPSSSYQEADRKRLREGTQVLLLWVIFSLLVVWGGLVELFGQQNVVPSRKRYDFQVARQNPFLQEYFLNAAFGMLSQSDRNGRRYYPGHPQMLANMADQLVVRFLAEVREDLALLQARTLAVRKTQQDFLAAPHHSEDRMKAQTRWKRSLELLADQSKQLRNRLAYVFLELEDKVDFRPEIDGRALESGFEKELRGVEEHLQKAHRQIADYFFAAGDTVQLHDLRDGNMLLPLFRAENVSKELAQLLLSSRR